MKKIVLAASIAAFAAPAFADGHIGGRLVAFDKVSGTPAAAGDRLVPMATRIIGDKGRGNGSEPFLGFADHDPNVAGGNGGDPDAE